VQDDLAVLAQNNPRGLPHRPWRLRGSRISWCQLDIQDAASVAATVASIKELDVLINNAGILIPTTTDLAQEMSNLEAMMDMHLHSPLKLIDALLPTLRASSQPMIVNMISMAAFASVPGCEATAPARPRCMPLLRDCG
jgi:NADP-dependent 3-hydroxy acid dehydrogenase YdfG